VPCAPVFGVWAAGLVVRVEFVAGGCRGTVLPVNVCSISAAGSKVRVTGSALLFAVGSCSPSCVPPNAVPLLVDAFGLKNPFKLCWPLLDAASATAVEPDFERFRGLMEDASVRGRFFPVDDVVLDAFEDVPAPVPGGAGVVAGNWFSTSAVSAFGAEKPAVDIALGVSLLVDCWTEGLQVNMSRMFLRPSNSGISFPDMGSISFVLYSLCRCPSENIAVGFMWSSR